MRIVVTAAVVVFLFAACSEQAPPVLSDAQVRRMRTELPGLKGKCLQRMRLHGFDAMSKAVDECFRMTPVKRWRGLWRNDFEGSQFCSMPAKECRHDGPFEVWLTYDDRACCDGKLYEVEFFGRRTAEPGLHGHLGVFQHDMIVDRMISIREVQETAEGPKK